MPIYIRKYLLISNWIFARQYSILLYCLAFLSLGGWHGVRRLTSLVKFHTICIFCLGRRRFHYSDIFWIVAVKLWEYYLSHLLLRTSFCSPLTNAVSFFCYLHTTQTVSKMDRGKLQPLSRPHKYA